jgi:multidrug efflux pump
VLLTIWIALAGIAAFFVLPVAPLPQVDFPVISVSASLPAPARRPWPAAWPRRWSGGWGTIAGVNEMTSNSGTGSTRVTCSSTSTATSTPRRARCRRRSTPRARPAVLAAQQPDLPQGQPLGGAGDHPGADLALRTPGQIYDAVSNIVQQKIAQVPGRRRRRDSAAARSPRCASS